MPKVTKAQRAKHEKLRANVDKLQNEIFAAAHPRRDVIFSDCRKLAPAAIVTAYDEALQALWTFEAELICEGRAWRAASGASIYFSN
jgi:hypothetical protein